MNKPIEQQIFANLDAMRKLIERERTQVTDAMVDQAIDKFLGDLEAAEMKFAAELVHIDYMDEMVRQQTLEEWK